MIDYRFGFVKRGLLGTLFSPFFAINGEGGIRIVGTLLTAVLCMILLWLAIRLVRACQFSTEILLVLALFFTSSYAVTIGHFNGYFDHVLMLLTICAYFLLKSDRPIIFSALLIGVGLLIHETILVVGLPSLIFFALVRYMKIAEPNSFGSLILGFWRKYKWLLIIPIAVFGWILLHQIFFQDASLQWALESRLSEFDFIEADMDYHVPEAYMTSFFTYIESNAPRFVGKLMDPYYLILIGLPLIFFMIEGWYQLILLPKYRYLLFLMFVGVTLAPLTLHLIAWDTSRIWSYPLLVAFLGVWGMSELGLVRTSAHKISPRFFIPAVTILLLQFFAWTPLMDGEIERFSALMRVMIYTPFCILLVLLLNRSSSSVQSTKQ